METLPVIDDIWDYNDPEATEKRFRDALQGVPEDNEEYRAELLTQIARTYSLRRLFDDAHAYLDEVAEMLPRTSERVETRYLLERGRAFNSAGDKEKAKGLFLKAVDAGKHSGDDNLTADAMHMMAIVETSEQALEWNLLTLRLVEDTKQERAKKWYGSVSNNVAWTYHDMSDYDTALLHFENALDHFQTVGKEPSLRIAKWAVARCKRSLSRHDEALTEQHTLLAEYFPLFNVSDAEPTTDGMDGYIVEEIGECYLASGKSEESKPYFKVAYELLSKDDWLVENESDRVARLKKLSE